MYSVQYIVYNVQYIVYKVQHTVYIVQYIVNVYMCKHHINTCHINLMNEYTNYFEILTGKTQMYIKGKLYIYIYTVVYSVQ